LRSVLARRKKDATVQQNGDDSVTIKNRLALLFGAAALGVAMLAGGNARANMPVSGEVRGDGTVYAGISPDTHKPIYTTPADAPGVYSWREGTAYCTNLTAGEHKDWRVPPRSELSMMFNNHAAIGGFDQSDTNSGWYLSSSRAGLRAWHQRFKDGAQLRLSNFNVSSLRCVRG
jgi:hypothetical protein